VRAIRIHETGGPDAMQLDEVDDPTPGPGQAVVRVAAAGVNFIDTYQRSGVYALELPSGIGMEGAGEVVAVGDGVSDVREGDIVAFTDQLGAYAELALVDAERVVRVPEGVEPDTAAAIMLQGITAHYLSHSTYPLGNDDTALVYAAAGGVGRLLVQLAKRRGARVLGCTSTEEKAAEVRRLGADEIVFYRDVEVHEEVRRLTGGRGVQVVYDSVGADTFWDSMASLAHRGTMVSYGQSSGHPPAFEMKDLNKGGSLYATRPSLAAHIVTRDELTWRVGALFELVRSGQLDVRIHDRYPLADAARAHTDLESGTTSGKLLLIPGDAA
jgi:NADPH:quinone reductase